MWVFTRSGFVSIVEDLNDRRRLLVRARLRGHLEALFPAHRSRVYEDYTADYQFRASIPRADVADFLARAVEEVEYPNFKAAVEPGTYLSACHEVWAVLEKTQRFARRLEREEEIRRGQKGLF